MYIFIISALVAMVLLTIFIRIKYNIVVNFGLYRPFNNAQKWGERILLLLSVIIIVVAVFKLVYPKKIFMYLYLDFLRYCQVFVLLWSINTNEKRRKEIYH